MSVCAFTTWKHLVPVHCSIELGNTEKPHKSEPLNPSQQEGPGPVSISSPDLGSEHSV